MTYETIGNISYKNKKALVQQMCNVYKELKEQERADNRKYYLSIKGLRSIDNKPIKQITFFETVLNILDPDYKKVIENDFLNQSMNREWFLSDWSKTKYYKLKNKAINSLIFNIYA